MATKTAVIIISEGVVLIWAIPPLLPQPPDFCNHNPTHMPPPLFTIPLPDISLHLERLEWNTICDWYSGSSQPLYFDLLFQDSKLHRFQIILKSDLSSASLHIINTPELTPHDFYYVLLEEYSICENTLVSSWVYSDSRQDQYQCGVYMGLTTPPSESANGMISHVSPAAKILLPDIGHKFVLFLCPASGRIVRMDSSNSVAVLDFF